MFKSVSVIAGFDDMAVISESVDVEHDKNGNDKHGVLNRLIAEEDASSEFSKGVVVLDPDLDNCPAWKQP